MPSHVGLRFYPTEQELLEFYLLHKITENPNLYQAGDDIPVKDCDLYGPHEPNLIWDLYEGDQLMAGQALYFFTQLKKVSPKGSRFNRKIGFGAWQGEDGAKPVLAVGSDDQILGFKKRFRYESRKNPEQNGRWIMHEFTINPALLGNQYSHKALDFVLCRVKKNESENHSEKANLGGKPRKSKQVGETNDCRRRSSGSKRKPKEVVASSSHIDLDDECFQSKRLKAEQNSVLIEQSHSPCSTNSLNTVDHQGEIIHSVPEYPTLFDVEEYMASLVQILEKDQHDEGSQNGQQGAEAEAVCIQQNQANDIPCSSNNNVQTVEFEGEMEHSLSEVYDIFDVERYSSSLDQILESERTEGHGDAAVQNKQQEAVEEEALLAQQNDPIELPCLDNILEIVESEVEIDSLPDRLVFDVREFLSELDKIAEPRDEEGGKLQAVAWEEEMGPLPVEFLSRVNQVLNRVM
ncbi:NAC domain-containing protein [Citrus sinensis]|nr:NAC domain-containing protein [Citrus sinensis]